jgi:TldD protein
MVDEREERSRLLKNLTHRALNTASSLGATYADVRVVEHTEQRVSTKNGVVETVSESQDRGFGVRVIAAGAWGFASSALLSKDEIDRVTALAVNIARASALVPGSKNGGVDIGPPVSHVGQYRTPVEIDPLGVPLESKIDILLQADAKMRHIQGVRVAEGNIVCLRETKTFANSEGSLVEQEIVETGCGIVATAVGEGEIQKRSYPNAFGRHQMTRGWEFVVEMDLPGHAEQIASEAVALLTAPQCPSGVTTLILGGAQLALQIHESCGHPIELDRVFGTEAAYAGTSFLTPDRLNSFRYGSEIVNLSADATIPGGLGTFGYDDEGVPAQRVPVVREGVFVGYLTSRETAAQLGLPGSGGAMRASGWNRIPLIRMTNVNLEPGAWTFDNLIADTDEGIYMDMNRSWSIDDKRLNFQFGTELAYEIKGGKLGRLLKNATYTGVTPEFWGACDAICNVDHWTVWGTPNCGKGQPSQVAHTGHGAAPARFRNVRVGIMT